MSLLISANLSDRIYLCADTRVSLKTGDKIIPLHNNLLKIIYLKDGIGVGCVGSPRFGAFIVSEINKEKTKTDINGLEIFLKENIGQITHNYLTTHREDKTTPTYDEAKVAMVFIGIDFKSNKKLSRKRLFEVTTAYQEANQTKVDNIFHGTPDKLTDEQKRRLVYEMSRSQMAMKGIIFQAIQKVKDGEHEIELPIFNQRVFLLEVDASKTNPIEFKDIEFGEIVVRGAGYDGRPIPYNERDLPDTFFGDIDLNANSGNVDTDLIPFISEIYSRYSDSIGGSITNMVIVNNAIESRWTEMNRMKAVPQGPLERIYHTKIINGEPHHLINDLWQKLKPFTGELDIASDGTLLF